ncbi:putative F-box protein [Raphanus sativus]|uniref:F-box protein At1g33020 n=1 Tax=Raphanus sativus TaxID=3726 RepID=A0A6J0KRR2_RAPSA|nr:putative F-box protein At1g33020 [Raphanus sativus]KAJ4880512.1 putative F-box protein [Raphanus sativus]
MNSIPLDLFYEIFSRLPAKSIGRCRCVSEQWRSILCSADFTEYCSTNSRPSLLFAMRKFNSSAFLFFSSPQIQSRPSSLAAPYFELNLPLYFCGHASGLFCFRRMKMTTMEMREDTVEHVICNPCMGQYVFLPKLKTTSYRSFLGFDPIDKAFKVLSPYSSSSAYILTFGTGERRWRKIHFPLDHKPSSEGICINGALYYLAREAYAPTNFIACFDVRSEKFKVIQEERLTDSDATLINYKGKLSAISLSQEEVRIWVLEDDEKQDWSEYAYTLPGDKFRDVECDVLKVYVAGVTSATGEIVLMNLNYQHPPGPFYVFYFHPERNVIKRVEVQGFGCHGAVDAFVDHVDDLRFDIKSWQPDVPRFESINKYNALRLLEDM